MKTFPCSVAVSPPTNQFNDRKYLNRNREMENITELFYKNTVLSLLKHRWSPGPFPQKEAKNTGRSSEKGKKDPSYRLVSTVT